MSLKNRDLWHHLWNVPGLHDPQMTEAATSLLHLGSSRGDRIEMQGNATEPRSSEERHLRSIFDRVIGVVFMDTPHKGAWIAN